MKSILFVTILLTLVNCLTADEGTGAAEQGESELEAGGMKEEWAKIKAVLCDPKKATDAMINAMKECVQMPKNSFGLYIVAAIANKAYEKCGKPNEDDIKDFTKVTNGDNKKHLMFRCSQKMKTCLKDAWNAKMAEIGARHGKGKDGKGKGGHGKGGGKGGKGDKLGEVKKEWAEKLKKMASCMNNAVKLA